MFRQTNAANVHLLEFLAAKFKMANLWHLHSAVSYMKTG